MTGATAAAAPSRPRGSVGVVGYAALFAVGLPLLLLLWMLRLDTLVPMPHLASIPVGAAGAAIGAAIVLAAIAALRRHGGGWPMSPYPPERLVSAGVYALVADPVYLGSVVICAGVAVALGSGAGLFVVTPVLALASAAFVLGYERDATRRRYGRTVTPRLAIPAGGARERARPSGWDRLSIYALVLAPWLLLYEAVEFLGVPSDARSTYLPFEAAWPLVPWTEAIYALAYPLVLLAPLVASRRLHLRRFALRGLAATAIVIPFYLLVPLIAPAKPVPGDTAWAGLLRLERMGDAAVTALPAFHVLWVCLAAEVFVARWPRLRWPAIGLAIAVGASCVASGMHAVLDVVAAFAAYGAIRSGAVCWAALCRVTEAVANSWRERTVGPVRFLSHGLYAGLGAALGVAASVAVAGSDLLWWLLAMAVAAEVGAAVWAQVVEGSSQLLRPYGYFGSVVAVLAVAPLAWACGADPWLLLAAMAVGACVTQPFGRLRCLIQGCCHGRPVAAPWGIRYRHPRSRVLRLGHLGGVPLHPAPLYSILSTLVVGLVLVRMWTLGLPLPFIAGTYFILIGLTRFVEEHYRGEPQTAWVAGLRLYQWLAIACLVAGAALTTVAGAPAPPPQPIPSSAWLALAVLGLVTYVAYGVDFPRSNRRFSRLA